MTYNFNLRHHGLMSDLWLYTSHCGGTTCTIDDEETEPISTLELYAPTMAQDTVICANDNYVNFHVATVSVKINHGDFNKKCGVPVKIVCYKIPIHMQAFSLSSFTNHEWKGSLGTRLR